MINGYLVLETSDESRGFHLVAFRSKKCLNPEIKHFNTYTNHSETEKMRDYMLSLPNRTIVAGVSAGEASRNMLKYDIYDKLNTVTVCCLVQPCRPDFPIVIYVL